MFCLDLISVFLEFSSFSPFSFLDFKAMFYLLIVRFFLYKQYSGRSFVFPDRTQKILETCTCFCKPRHTVKNERKKESAKKVLLEGRGGVEVCFTLRHDSKTHVET